MRSSAAWSTAATRNSSSTAEQRAELAKLPMGSDECREYLYKLGTDADVLAKQSLQKYRRP